MAPFVLLMACGKKQTSREEIQSDLIESISLSSETEIFVRYIGHGHSTYNFATGHLHYLFSQVNRKRHELSQQKAPPDLINVLNTDRVQLDLLAAELETIQAHRHDSRALSESDKQIRKIHTALVQASSSL